MVSDASYPHLSSAARDIIHLPPDERLGRLACHCWIGYSAAQSVIARMEQLFSQPPVLRPPNLLIVGPSNNGKSMIAERFRRMHPQATTPDGMRQIIPVLIMQLPSSVTVRR